MSAWNVPNQDEYQPVIGLDSLYAAKVLQDDAADFVVDTPLYLAPTAEAKQAPTMNQSTEYYDNSPMFVVSSRGETKIDLTLSNLPAEVQAALTGGTFDAATGRVFDHEGKPPYYALGFRSQKLNEKYRFYWFLKGQFTPPAEEAATQTDKTDTKKASLSYTAIRTTHEFEVSAGVNKKVKRVYGDEDTPNFSSANWFAQVQVPGVSAVAALALSASDPADGAAAVAVDKTITLTFNNPLPAGAIKNVVVTKNDGTVVACTNSLDAARKVMTVNPDVNLGAGSTYIVSIGVVDIYGQALNTAINFATA